MNKLALIILDGWGIGKPNAETNAIYAAHTPFMDRIWQEWPHTQLQASHEYVGLPHGQIGGSEVGHLTIGAGRVFFQDLPRINRALNEPENPEYGIYAQHTFQEFIQIAQAKQIHLIGMVSPGGIHSHQDHLYALLEIMKAKSCKSPVIHFISDGRDTRPQSGLSYAQALDAKLKELNYGKVVDVVGRFYAMDRDNNIDRIEKATNLMAEAKAEKRAPNLEQAFEDNYAAKLTDELMEPVLVDSDFHGIQPGDPLFFFNFRSDRMKQIVTRLHELYPHNATFTMTKYDKSYEYPVFFDKQNIDLTLGKIVSDAGVEQLRAAETDKVPHVTYFFNGGTEITYPGEHRIFQESTKETYDKTPKMRAHEIADSVIKSIDQTPQIGFVVVNFANADLVGHFGNFASTVQACETVDHEVGRLCTYLDSHGYICVITADHGNADEKRDEKTGEPLTAHTVNPVPFVIYAPHRTEFKQVILDQSEGNGLSKIAGTVLDLMAIPRPEHDFESLIVRNA